MRIGDFSRPISTHDNPQPPPWDNSDRAYLNLVMTDSYTGLGCGPFLLQWAPQDSAFFIGTIQGLQDSVDKLKNYLLNTLVAQLPPDQQKQLKDLVADFESALKEVQDPKTQDEAAVRLDNDSAALMNLCQNYI